MSVGAPGEAEVHEDDAPGFAEHDVSGLDVAVDDAGLVDGVESAEERCEDGEGFFRGEALVEAEGVAEGDPAHEFHGVVAEVRVLADGVDANEVGVVHSAEGAGFFEEAAAVGFLGGEVGGEYFDGDFALESGVVGPEDGGHAAAPEGLAEFVSSEFSEGFGHGNLGLVGVVHRSVCCGQLSILRRPGHRF